MCISVALHCQTWKTTHWLQTIKKEVKVHFFIKTNPTLNRCIIWSRRLPVDVTSDCPEMKTPSKKCPQKLFKQRKLLHRHKCCFVYNVQNKADVRGSLLKPGPLSPLLSLYRVTAAWLFPAVAWWGSWWQWVSARKDKSPNDCYSPRKSPSNLILSCGSCLLLSHVMDLMTYVCVFFLKYFSLSLPALPQGCWHFSWIKNIFFCNTQFVYNVSVSSSSSWCHQTLYFGIKSFFFLLYVLIGCGQESWQAFFFHQC